MANKINPSEDNNIFKVKGNGTIERIGNADLQGNNSALDKELLDIIEVNSYSKNLLAAYKARKIANKIAKSEYAKQNYKEYVEMLMVKHFPKELEKAQLGGKYLFWLWILIIIVVVSLFFSIVFSSVGYMWGPATVSYLATISGILSIWKIVLPFYKQIKELQK